MRIVVDRREFLEDLKRMRKSCLKDINYNPENDIAYLVCKYNLGRKNIWEKIKELLTLNQEDLERLRL